MNIVTATQLKSNMKALFNLVISNKEEIIVKRPHGQDMVIVELSEYESLKETAYLLSSQANADHLIKSLDQLEQKKSIKKSLKDIKN